MVARLSHVMVSVVVAELSRGYAVALLCARCVGACVSVRGVDTCCPCRCDRLAVAMLTLLLGRLGDLLHTNICVCRMLGWLAGWLATFLPQPAPYICFGWC